MHKQAAALYLVYYFAHYAIRSSLSNCFVNMNEWIPYDGVWPKGRQSLTNEIKIHLIVLLA